MPDKIPFVVSDVLVRIILISRVYVDYLVFFQDHRMETLRGNVKTNGR